MTTSKFGPNTGLVEDFVRLLAGLNRDQKILIGHRDGSRALAFSATGSLWAPAYLCVVDELDRRDRAHMVGPAWLAVRRAFGEGHWAFAARPVVEALLVWEFLSAEHRATMWAPFARVAAQPGAEKGVA